METKEGHASRRGVAYEVASGELYQKPLWTGDGFGDPSTAEHTHFSGGAVEIESCRACGAIEAGRHVPEVKHIRGDRSGVSTRGQVQN